MPDNEYSRDASLRTLARGFATDQKTVRVRRTLDLCAIIGLFAALANIRDVQCVLSETRVTLQMTARGIGGAVRAAHCVHRFYWSRKVSL